MYDVARLLPIFTSILGEYKEFARHEYYFYCPFCAHHRPKFALNMSKGKWHCWKCGSAGSTLYSLAKRLSIPQTDFNKLKEILSDSETYYVYKNIDGSKASLVLPSEYTPLWKDSDAYDYKHALAYLNGRGITREDIIRYRLGYCPAGVYSGRIIIPSYDENNQLNYFVARDFWGHSPLKYKNPPVSKNVVGFENSINWKCPIVLCEGVFDAMAIKWNAVPLFGTFLPEVLRTRISEKNVTEIFMALDSDATIQSIKLLTKFMKNGLKVYRLDFSQKDPSVIGFSKMLELLQRAEPITFKDVLSLKLNEGAL